MDLSHRLLGRVGGEVSPREAPADAEIKCCAGVSRLASLVTFKRANPAVFRV